MAEGDSIFRLARRLEPVLAGREIVAASAPNPRSPLPGGVRRLLGQRVERIETRGKHLLIHLGDGLSLHSHLGMNGSWRVDEGHGFGKPERAAWLLIDLGAGTPDDARPDDPTGTSAGAVTFRVAQFGGPTLRLVRSAELDRDPRLATLGPDVLSPGFDPETAGDRLRDRPDEIGVALLDQTLVSGIGNIFKSEACFEAKVDPWRPGSSLSGPEATRLLVVARDQMLDAVETGRRPGRVYRKAGRPCPGCRRARIRSRPQGDDARTTYWCPNCQF